MKSIQSVKKIGNKVQKKIAKQSTKKSSKVLSKNKCWFQEALFYNGAVCELKKSSDEIYIDILKVQNWMDKALRQIFPSNGGILTNSASILLLKVS